MHDVELTFSPGDGAKLAQVGSYVSKYALKQIRLSGNGRFIVAQAGGSGFEILDVSDFAKIRLVKMERCRNGGLVRAIATLT